MGNDDGQRFEILTLEEVERRHVLKVLRACNGNRLEAARILGIDRKTLARKLARWTPAGDD
jgi:two-component system response regulator HydG